MFPDSGKSEVKTPILFSTDKALLNEFFNDLFIYRKVNKTQGTMLKRMKNQATALINYFDKKYDLE